MAGTTAGFALFFVGLTTFARWTSRDEVTYLRSWLAERLQSQGSLLDFRPPSGASPPRR
jgi:hypothetical protein